ncbi:hypothetical protein L4D20_02485 [Vibrio kyushuensis]|uniref:hypothetical protein n=1 Tax=Vibrio TaxID=662 RepID=UPI003D129BC8
MKKLIGLVILTLSFKAIGCAVDAGGFSAGLPQHRGALTTLMNIATARQSDDLPARTMPEQVLIWQLAQQLGQTKPDLDITFYQAIEGHYSKFSSSSFSIFKPYPDNTMPTNQELMVISEFDVLAALLNKELTWKQVLEYKLLIINGETEEIEQVQEWLKTAFS